MGGPCNYWRLSPEAKRARVEAACARVRAERAAARRLGLCRCGDPLRFTRAGELGADCEGCWQAYRVKRAARTKAPREERPSVLRSL